MIIRLADDLFTAFTEEEKEQTDMVASARNFFSRVEQIVSEMDFNEEIVKKIQGLFESNLWIIDKK